MIYFNEWLEEQKRIEAFKEECLKYDDVTHHYCYILEDGTPLHIDKDELLKIAKKYFDPNITIDNILKNKNINWIEVYYDKDINWIKLPDNEPNNLQYGELKSYISLTFVNYSSFIIFTNGYEHHTIEESHIIEENKIHTDGKIAETIIWFIKYFYQYGLLFTSMDEVNLYIKAHEEEK